MKNYRFLKIAVCAVLLSLLAAGITALAASVPGGRYCYDMVMQIGEEGFCGFLSLLHLEYPDFIPTGVFGERNF